MFSAAPWTAVLILLVVELAVVLAFRLGVGALHAVAGRHDHSGSGMDLSAQRTS